MTSHIFETREEAQEAAAELAGDKTLKRHENGWELVVRDNPAGAVMEAEAAEDEEADED